MYYYDLVSTTVHYVNLFITATSFVSSKKRPILVSHKSGRTTCINMKKYEKVGTLDKDFLGCVFLSAVKNKLSSSKYRQTFLVRPRYRSSSSPRS